MKPRYAPGCLLTIALAACSSASAPPNDGGVTPPSTAPTASPSGAPVSTLLACGEANVTLTDPCPVRAREGIACLAAAAAECRVAEYVQTSQTDEGGTVINHYTVQPRPGGCGVSVETDFRGDPHGPTGKTKTECRSAELAKAASGCNVLHPTGCGEPVSVP
ncbi:MAG: hypothetical protein JNK04_11885 [Myxococcales bacterium]|nr:hypothetical protein [Myxococcales bacterium]